jgi:hypothetical protein
MDPNSDDDRSQPGGQQPTSRRRDVRLTALDGLQTTIVNCAGRVELQDLSLGGLRLLTSSPLSRNRVYEIEIRLGPTLVVRRGRAVHCRHVGPSQWTTGICFTADPFPGPTIEQLVDAILSAQLHLS